MSSKLIRTRIVWLVHDKNEELVVDGQPYNIRRRRRDDAYVHAVGGRCVSRERPTGNPIPIIVSWWPHSAKEDDAKRLPHLLPDFDFHMALSITLHADHVVR